MDQEIAPATEFTATPAKTSSSSIVASVSDH